MSDLVQESAPVIHAVGLHKSYRSGSESAFVLRGVELTVAKGECVFLVGPSGSGKTTLLSIAGCLLSADAGQLQILGADVQRLSPARRCRFRCEHIGFVFQRYHLFDALTALENVCIPCDLSGWPKAASRRRGVELLAQVGLAGKADQRASQLSMGQRQRVALARALAADPDLILADEPTASLDAESGLAAMRLLKQLCAQLQKTVLVVTHDPRIEFLADRILILSDGQIVGSPAGPPATLSGAA